MRTPGSTARPVIFGEALFDWFPDGRHVLGGAPFNVAWHLQGFGRHPLMISRVGADDPGREILARMTAWGMDSSGIQTDDAHPTGRVTVRFVDGEPAFAIEDQQAYDCIHPEAVRQAIEGADAGMLYHGTLALRHATSRDALGVLAESLDAPIVCDVNLRAPWWTDEGVAACLAAADWAKLNDTELAELTERETASPAACEAAARRLATRHGLRGVIVTRGADGAGLLLENGSMAWAAAPPLADVVDTVGAGDAFSAVMIAGILAAWPPAVSLERAVRFAADMCAVAGATTPDPSLYRKHLAAWRDHESG